MKYEGTTYRPPPEADTPLLQVTVGCAHNRCTFCGMYRDVSFRRIPMAQIESDLKELRGIFPRADRVFLVNGDAFVLKADLLKEIAAKVKNTFPECRTISMYASISNIRSKSDQDLIELKEAGINDLYVGVETGWDRIVEDINKGHTEDEARQQLERLNRVGIRHIASLMLGVAGKGKGLENARHTAAFLNHTRPVMIWIGTLAVFKGTELYEKMAEKTFIPPTEGEILEEEKALIQAIDLDDVMVYGVHPTNTVRVSGRLPKDRQAMIDAIDRGIGQLGAQALTRVFARTSL